MGAHVLVACPRQPGQTYRAEEFIEPAEAEEAVAALTAVLTPVEGVDQEVYINTRHFSR
jgi:hypothetical protein